MRRDTQINSASADEQPCLNRIDSLRRSVLMSLMKQYPSVYPLGQVLDSDLNLSFNLGLDVEAKPDEALEVVTEGYLHTKFIQVSAYCLLQCEHNPDKLLSLSFSPPFPSRRVLICRPCRGLVFSLLAA